MAPTELTLDELKSLVSHMAVDTDRIKKNQEVDNAAIKKMQEKNAIAQEKNAIAQEKTEKMLQSMGIHLDGISKSQGLDAEEFFLSSLQKSPYLGDIKFDIVSKQGTKRNKGDEYQMDIFLENGNSVGIVEVKTKAKMDHLKQLDALVERFDTFYTTHSGMKKYAAIAAKIMPKNVEESALKKGFFVLKQQGNHLEVKSPMLG